MNIAFFLLPKKDVICLTPNSTIRQALERMEFHRYTAVPLLDDEGRYVGTLTEGDLLWMLKNTQGLSFDNCHRIKLKDVPQRIHNEAVLIDAEMTDLLSLAINQNFVPVVDDNRSFIGIIRRREILEYCAQHLKDNSTFNAPIA
jgi:CBS domain-containing protein